MVLCSAGAGVVLFACLCGLGLVRLFWVTVACLL